MRTGREIVALPTWDLLDGHVVGADVLEALAAIPDCTVDSVVCDPPYGIGFMGHDWDQPGEYGALRGNGRPAPFASGKKYPGKHVIGGREQIPPGQRRNKQPAPSGFTRTGGVQGNGGSMEAGRYDLSVTANRRYQAWCEAWARECFRVLKPGGHLLASCGTRTYHRLAAGVEDAGFEIRDRILSIRGDEGGELDWLYGSGFPKNLDVSKAIDKAAGAERKVVGQRTDGRYAYEFSDAASKALGKIVALDNPTGFTGGAKGEITEAATPEAKQWEGFGTALKPAHEPIVMARKPLVGTVVANVLEFGTGALNIGGCQIGFASEADEEESKAKNQHAEFGSATGTNKVYDDFSMVPKLDYDAPGRWPANVILTHAADCALVGYTEVESDGHYPATRGPSGYGSDGNFPESTGGGLKGHDDLDERHTAGEVVEVWECAPGCPVAMLNAQSGISRSPKPYEFGGGPSGGYGGGIGQGMGHDREFGDVGGAARFFYVAKSSRGEREAGLRGKLPCLVCGDVESHTHPAPSDKDPDRREECRRNGHPTVKPIDLERQLIRLVTPPGGLVLIPFLGSGSEGCAAILDGFEVVGIEREDGTAREDYTRLASLRIEWWEQHRGREAEAVLKASRRVERKAKEHRESGQLELELT